MEKCSVCGKEIDKKPCIDEKGHCDACGMKLNAEESQFKK
jgi:hypothetical protein